MSKQTIETLTEHLETLKTDSESLIVQADSSRSLEDVKTLLIGKKGRLTDVLKHLGQLGPEERPRVGKLANEIKERIQELIDNRKKELDDKELHEKLQRSAVDVTLPPTGIKTGRRHPINQVLDELLDIFTRLGFSVKSGRDVEDDYYNFEALNIPADHPSRDMHDTFYLKSGNVLRTHTSPVQVHEMEKHKPPIKIVVPGKVYRCDSDVSHSPIFHQLEGLYVDKNVTFAHLKGTLEFFLHELFGKDKKVRFRPSYFPFTEPSTEIDVECVNCNGKGCSTCKQTGWIEILGAGMVNRNVFRAVGYNPEEITGFAFGIGIDRVTMLKFGIHDIRLLYENDIRFLNQF